MGFFNDLSKKTSETTSRIARETKLKLKISDNNGRIKDLYEDIGKKFYMNRLKKVENCKEQIEDDCIIIDQLFAEIEKAKLEILGLYNKKLCHVCKAEMDKEIMFCPNCGEKQKEEEDNADDGILRIRKIDIFGENNVYNDDDKK